MSKVIWSRVENEEAQVTANGAADDVPIWPAPKGTRATLVAFVNAWNKPVQSKTLLVELQALSAEREGAGLRIVALDATMADPVEKLGAVTFPVLYDTAGVHAVFGVAETPALVLVDAAGKVAAFVRSHQPGALETGALGAALERLIGRAPRLNRAERVRCAERLVTSIAAGEVTAWDLRRAWLLGMTGGAGATKEKPVSEDELARAKRIARSLKPRALHVRPGDVEVGDLLFNQLPWDEKGLVAAVRTWDPERWEGSLDFFDEQQGKRSDRPNWQLSTDPPDAKERLMRPGWFALRPVDTALCEKAAKKP